MNKKLLLTVFVTVMFAIADATAGIALPYYNPCDKLDGMTQDNASQNRNWVAEDGHFRIAPSNSTTTQDAYLWLPAIDLQKDKSYRFAIDAMVLRSTPGSFEFVISDKPSRSGNVTVIATKTDIRNWNTPYDSYYNCTAAGEYYLGIHVTCPGASDNFYIDNIDVKEVSPRVPLAVSGIKATPASGGKKELTISFTTPTKRVGGGRGLDLSRVDILCDGMVVKSIENPEKGAELSYVHTSSMCGRHLFTVIPYSPEGAGAIASLLAHIGTELNQPDYIYNYNSWRYTIPATYNDSTRKVTLKWNPRKGDEKARYNIYRMPDNIKVATELTDTTFTEARVESQLPIAYYYKVDAVYNDSTINLGNSSTISLYAQEPFHLVFNAPESIYECTVEEGDNSSSGWWSVATGSNPAAAVSASDDWLTTPGITLEAGKLYRISTTMSIPFSPASYSVSIGRANTFRSMTTEIQPTVLVSSKTGEEHECYFRAPENGQYFIGVHALCEDEQSVYPTLRMHKIAVELMNDELPAAVENPRVEYNADDASKAQIVMNAPSKTLGSATLSALTKIELIKDGAVIATKENPTPGAAVAFDINVVSEKKETYIVKAVNNAGEGPESSLNVLLINPPYTNPFDSAEAIEGYTLVDVGNDGFGWNWFNHQLRCYPYFESGPCEDWAITPAVHLEKGKYYRTSFVIANEEDSYAPNTISLKLGREPKIESMTTTVIKEYQPWGVGYYERALLKDYFTVSESGTYYLAFHNKAADGRNCSPLLIDDFSISKKINGEVPDTITSFEVLPNRDGELRGEVKFKAPVKALNGTLLDKSKSIQLHVFVNEKSIGALDALPGESVGCPVSVDSTGVYIVTVIGLNEYGQGREAEQPAFFGINRPGNPYNVKAVENNNNYGEVTISWSPSKYDFDGFPIDQKHVKFEIIDISGSNETVLVTNLTDTTYTYQARTPKQPQQFMRFAVRARTSAGGSQGVMAPYIAVGKPYSIPVAESFASCSPKMTLLQQAVDESSGMCMWGFNNVDPYMEIEPYDRDGGIALMEAIFAGVRRRMLTGKIDLREATNPTLSLRVLRYPKTQNLNTLQLEVATNTNEWDSIACKTVDEWCDGEDYWQRIEVDLSKYVGKIVYIGFVATSESHTWTLFDAMEISERKEKNLGHVSLVSPETVNCGESFPIKVRVRNQGHSKAEGYTLELFRDGESVQTIEGTPLEPGQKTDFSFIERHDIDAKDSYRYYVMINYTGDEDEFDNRSNNFDIAVKDTDFPAPQNLTGSQNYDTNRVELNWEAPVVPEKAQRITDDFEKYDSWNNQYTGVGNYNFLDYDDTRTVELRLSSGTPIIFPGIEPGSKQSWFVFDNTLSPFDQISNARAHSGNKYMASLQAYGNFSDDWLISPELSGEEQTISFYARSFQSDNPENFMIHWSYDGYTFRDMAHEETSYPLVGSVPAEWTKYEYKLPAGAKYFAIRRYTSRGMLMFIDDLSYIPAGHERLKLEGYNVYCDGTKLNGTTPVTATSYNHTPEDGNHTYSVAAQYNMGQSPLTDVSVGFTGMDDLGNRLSVTGAKGYVYVNGAVGLHVEIISADGLKVYSAIPSVDRLSIPVPAGVYAVKVADKSFKVMVR